jgi:hypothetical protein
MTEDVLSSQPNKELSSEKMRHLFKASFLHEEIAEEIAYEKRT